MTAKSFDGHVPDPGELRPDDTALLDEVDRLLVEEAELVERVELRAGLRKALAVAQAANAYLNAQEPWKTAKTDMDRTATVLNTTLQAIGAGAIAFAPYTPFASATVLDWLGLDDDPVATGWRRPEVQTGTELGVPEVLFPKIELPEAPDEG